MLVLSTLLCDYCPSNLLSGNFVGSESDQKKSVKILQNMVSSTAPPPPPPFPKSKYIQTVCSWEGVGEAVELCWRPYSAGVLHSVFQIQNLPNCSTTPNKHLGGEGSLRLFWSKMALASLVAISGPIKDSISRAHAL
jgi:hypothetical protein